LQGGGGTGPPVFFQVAGNGPEKREGEKTHCSGFSAADVAHFCPWAHEKKGPWRGSAPFFEGSSPARFALQKFSVFSEGRFPRLCSDCFRFLGHRTRAGESLIFPSAVVPGAGPFFGAGAWALRSILGGGFPVWRGLIHREGRGFGRPRPSFWGHFFARPSPGGPIGRVLGFPKSGVEAEVRPPVPGGQFCFLLSGGLGAPKLFPRGHVRAVFFETRIQSRGGFRASGAPLLQAAPARSVTVRFWDLPPLSLSFQPAFFLRKKGCVSACFSLTGKPVFGGPKTPKYGISWNPPGRMSCVTGAPLGCGGTVASPKVCYPNFEAGPPWRFGIFAAACLSDGRKKKPSGAMSRGALVKLSRPCFGATVSFLRGPIRRALHSALTIVFGGEARPTVFFLGIRPRAPILGAVEGLFEGASDVSFGTHWGPGQPLSHGARLNFKLF